MPTGTKVDRVYRALLKQGHSAASAARIAQAQTGKALATGKRPKQIALAGPSFTRVGPPPPPPRPTNAAREAGHAAADRFNAQSDRASMAKYSHVGPDIVAPKGGTVGPKPPLPPGKPQAPAGQIAMSEENDQMIQPSSTRVTSSPGNKILQDLRQAKEQREGTGNGSNLPSSNIDYATELTAKHTGTSRPAWQQLPETDTGNQPSRSDFRKAGFRVGKEPPVIVRK